MSPQAPLAVGHLAAGADPRYRGPLKTHLEHAFSAVALNLLRLDAWWNGHPLDRIRTGHFARLDFSLAAARVKGAVRPREHRFRPGAGASHRAEHTLSKIEFVGT
ncbi:hypothetical protein [Streptomyces aureus]|uniref:hypothetical protein n=1 Tax=Streptomyces aureus TaxID=193461 RepID=UPI0031DD2A4A